jgi:hypothetical protein
MNPYGIARIKELARANADQTGLHMSLKGVFITTGRTGLLCGTHGLALYVPASYAAQHPVVMLPQRSGAPSLFWF